MVWQDAALLITNLVFGFFLIPQIIDLHRKKTAMNILSGIATLSGLFVFGVVYATLGLWLGVVGDAIDICAWFVVVVLSVRNNRR